MKLYHSSRKYLDPYRPELLGIDLDQLLDQHQVCCAELLASSDEFPSVEIDPELIPEIHLRASG